MLDAIDCITWLHHIIAELIGPLLKPSVLYTDNQSLFDNVHSTTAVEEKRVRIEISSIRESIRRKKISVHWVEKHRQLADVLTKQGADITKLIGALQGQRV